MNVDELEALVVVVESGSLQSAAKTLRISRATLRSRIDALEERVGLPLIDRGRLGALPTPAGEALAARGRILIQQARALVAAVGEVGTQPTGLLRIAMPVGLPPMALMMLFLQLRLRFPRLTLRATPMADPVAGLLNDVDIAFHFGPRAPLGPWLTSVIIRVPERLVATRTYLQMYGTPADPEALRQHTLLSWEPPGEDARRWEMAGSEVTMLDPVLVSPDVHLIRAIMLAHTGIARVPDAGLPDPGLGEEEVVTVLPACFTREVALRVLVPEVLAEMPKARMVLDFIREFVGGL